MARKTDVIIIGGGQAGLATSHCLTRMGIAHVVLERGQIAQRWRSERWNSLRLLTPNWMTRLPGHAYPGDDPSGFMHKDQVTRMLEQYGRGFNAPVMTETVVRSVWRSGSEFCVQTSRGTWKARAVVLATGACDKPRVPDFAGKIAPDIRQVSLNRYKSPDQIERGGVLVVGASASGIQLATELLHAGRDVTLAVGRHTRIPRRYRGRDIMYWLDRSGFLSQRRDPQADPDAMATQHSFQLAGDPGGCSIDLATFQSGGGQITGRLCGIDTGQAIFADTLSEDIGIAERRQARVLAGIDGYIAGNCIQVPDAVPATPVPVPRHQARIGLGQAGIRTILWATGYRREYGWLDIPVLTRGGEIIQRGGITPVRGLYTMGLPAMRRRNSTFIDGVGQDARDITRHIATQLGHSVRLAA